MTQTTGMTGMRMRNTDAEFIEISGRKITEAMAGQLEFPGQHSGTSAPSYSREVVYPVAKNKRRASGRGKQGMDICRVTKMSLLE